MAYFLAKTDPTSYSIDDLERDRRTVWDGVRNAQAVQAIRAMQPGDTAFIYHSQGEAAVVGVARILSAARQDPQEARSWVVDVEFERKLKRPVTLKEIKESGLFDDWSLVRQGRLSTMTAPEIFVNWLRERGAL